MEARISPFRPGKWPKFRMDSEPHHTKAAATYRGGEVAAACNYVLLHVISIKGLLPLLR